MDIHIDISYWAGTVVIIVAFLWTVAKTKAIGIDISKPGKN